MDDMDPDYRCDRSATRPRHELMITLTTEDAYSGTRHGRHPEVLTSLTLQRKNHPSKLLLFSLTESEIPTCITEAIRGLVGRM